MIVKAKRLQAGRISCLVLIIVASSVCHAYCASHVTRAVIQERALLWRQEVNQICRCSMSFTSLLVPMLLNLVSVPQIPVEWWVVMLMFGHLSQSYCLRLVVCSEACLHAWSVSDRCLISKSTGIIQKGIPFISLGCRIIPHTAPSEVISDLDCNEQTLVVRDMQDPFFCVLKSLWPRRSIVRKHLPPFEHLSKFTSLKIQPCHALCLHYSIPLQGN